MTAYAAELVDRRLAVLGEGPVWLAEANELLWIDIIGGHLHFADADGAHLRSVTVGGDVGVALPGEDGSILLATDRGLSLVTPEGEVREINDQLADRPDLRFNDGKVGPRGHVLVGTLSRTDEPHASFFARVDPGPTLTTLFVDVTCSNGLDWSPDGRTFYYIDTLSYRIDAFNYEPDTGELSRRRTLVELPVEWGYPDGMCADTDGGLWVAFSGGSAVRRFTSEGEVDVVVEVPVPGVTSCAFGGPDLGTLFITTTQINVSDDDLAGRFADSGSLYAVRTGHTGPPPTLWRRDTVFATP